MHHYDNYPRVSSSLLIAFNATKQCLTNSWLFKAVVVLMVVGSSNRSNSGDGVLWVH